MKIMKITSSLILKTSKGASSSDKDFSSNLNTRLYSGLMKNLSERNSA